MGLVGMLLSYREKQKKLELERLKVLGSVGQGDLGMATASMQLQQEIQQLRKDQQELREQVKQLTAALNPQSLPEDSNPGKDLPDEASRRIAEIAKKLGTPPSL